MTGVSQVVCHCLFFHIHIARSGGRTPSFVQHQPLELLNKLPNVAGDLGLDLPAMQVFS